MDNQSHISRWIADAKARGQAPFLLTLLDAIKPIAPLMASCLLAAQPLIAGWHYDGALRELADLLEEPQGFEALRRQLAEASTE